MKQDATTGLWVPDNFPEAKVPVFPPRLNVPEDTKHPTFINNLTRGNVEAVKGWWDELPQTKAVRKEA